MTPNRTRNREQHDWGRFVAGLVGLTAIAVAVVLAISLAPASAETPAERCKRETTAYNNAWKNSWAASHPGKKPSDAPKPPVPYKCGSSNDGPPPTAQPTTTKPEPSAEPTAPTTVVPSGDLGANMNTPTSRRDILHPESRQRPISPGSNAPTVRLQRAPNSTSTPQSERGRVDVSDTVDNYDGEYPSDEKLLVETDKCGNEVILRRGYWDPTGGKKQTGQGLGWDKIYHHHKMQNMELIREAIKSQCGVVDDKDPRRQTLVYRYNVVPNDCRFRTPIELDCTPAPDGAVTLRVVVQMLPGDPPKYDDGMSVGVISAYCEGYRPECPRWVSLTDRVRTIYGGSTGGDGTDGPYYA